MDQNTQPPSQIPPPLVTHTVPPPPKNNSGVLIGILLLLLGILIGLGLAKTTLLSGLRIPYLSPTPTPIASPKPTAEAGDPTADWKTYTDSGGNFSFKYPATYQYIRFDWGVTGFFDNVSVFQNCQTYIQQGIKNINNPCLNSKFYFNGFQTFSQIEYQNFLKSRIEPKDYTDSQGRIWKTDQVLGEAYNFQGVLNLNGIFYSVSFQANQSMFTSEDSQNFFDQILSTFKFIGQSSAVSPTPAVPPNWIRHTFNTYGLTMYTPDDWQSSITDYPADSNSLVKFWKKSSPTIVPIQLDIKSSWDNTGNAESQPKNFMVDGSIPAYRMDPPTKDQQTLDRYQTNVYFEHGSKVYVFECVHNWTQDYLNTCNTMLSTLQFTQ